MSSPSSFLNIIWRFLKPEIEELAVYIVILIGFIISGFIRAASGNASVDAYGTGAALQLIEESLQFITNGSDTVAKLFTFGTWFVIGTSLYILVWFLVSFAGGAFKEVEVSSSYMHPRTFNKSSYWLAIISRLAVQISAGITLLLYITFWCAVLAPAWHASFTGLFSNGFGGTELVDASIAAVGIGLTLHIAAIIVRLVLLRSRYSYQR